MKFVRNWDAMNQRLQAEAKSSGGSQNSDPRFFKPNFNKDGTFGALIRFLPAPGNELPLVKKFSHSFKGKVGRFSEECPTTIGKQCPVCDKNTESWNNHDEDTARNRARGKTAISNIYVINDPQTPDNNGKVFLYRYGKTITEKIMAAINPSDSEVKLGTKPVNVFDYYTGANFRIKAHKVNAKSGGGTFPKYDESVFETVSSLGDERLIESIEKQLVSLAEFTNSSNFKTYEELEVILNRVLGVGSHAVATAPIKDVNVDTKVAETTTAHVEVKDKEPTVVNEEDKKLAIDAKDTKSGDDFWNELEQ